MGDYENMRRCISELADHGFDIFAAPLDEVKAYIADEIGWFQLCIGKTVTADYVFDLFHKIRDEEMLLVAPNTSTKSVELA